MKIIYWIGLFCPVIWCAFGLLAIIINKEQVWLSFLLTAVPVSIISLFTMIRFMTDPATRHLTTLETWRYLKEK